MIFESIKELAAMKIKSLFSRYRWVICFVLLILACLAARYVIVWYRTRPPNNVRVYDLTWADRTGGDKGGDVVYRRWRYFVETKTNLLRKIEKYSKLDLSGDYTLEETLVISYPTDDEIREVIKDAGFGDLPERNVDVSGVNEHLTLEFH